MTTKQGLIKFYENERDKNTEYALKIKERLKTGKLDEVEASVLSNDFKEHKLIAQMAAGIIKNLEMLEGGSHES